VGGGPHILNQANDVPASVERRDVKASPRVDHERGSRAAKQDVATEHTEPEHTEPRDSPGEPTTSTSAGDALAPVSVLPEQSLAAVDVSRSLITFGDATTGVDGDGDLRRSSALSGQPIAAMDTSELFPNQPATGNDAENDIQSLPAVSEQSVAALDSSSPRLAPEGPATNTNAHWGLDVRSASGHGEGRDDQFADIRHVHSASGHDEGPDEGFTGFPSQFSSDNGRLLKLIQVTPANPVHTSPVTAHNAVTPAHSSGYDHPNLFGLDTRFTYGQPVQQDVDFAKTSIPEQASGTIPMVMDQPTKSPRTSLPPGLGGPDPRRLAAFDAVIRGANKVAENMRAQQGKSLHTAKVLLSAETNILVLVSEETSPPLGAAGQTSQAPQELSNLAEVYDKPLTDDDSSLLDNVRPMDADQSLKRKQKAAKETLLEAWCDREAARVKLLGTFTLDGAKELEKTTWDYNAKRAELEQLMPSGKLGEQVAQSFPVLSSSNTSAPRCRPTGALKMLSLRAAGHNVKEAKDASTHSQDVVGSSETKEAVSSQPASTGEETKKLREKAHMAYTLYLDANKNSKRKPKKDREARALRYYQKKRQELEEASPDDEALQTELPSL
jgi:hypothetical protein